eukprot:2481393-Prymnesium_polylepis.1
MWGFGRWIPRGLEARGQRPQCRLCGVLDRSEVPLKLLLLLLKAEEGSQVVEIECPLRRPWPLVR